MSAVMTPTDEAATAIAPSALKVTVKQPGPCQRHVEAHVAPAGIEPLRESVLREFQREATLPGFRKGKAPRDMIERRYADEIREELVRRLTRQACEQITESHQLRPVGPFEVSKLDFDPAKGLSLEANVEVEPEFELGDYRGITLTNPAIDITPQECREALARLQESMAELAPIGEGQEKERRVPALDDELAKDLGFDTLQTLTTHVEAKLREQKSAEQRRGIEEKLYDQLLARHKFDVPERLVARQADRLARDFQVRLLMAEYAEEQVKQELEKYQDQLRNNAVRHVKLAFIMDRVADKESLSVTQDELVDRLWKLAKRSGKDPAEVRRVLDAQGLWPSVVSSIRQEKTVAFLMHLALPDEAAAAQTKAST